MRFAIACWASVFVVLAPAGASIVAASSQPCSLDVASVLHAFAQQPGVEVRFAEERHITLLEQPLKNSGLIYYAAPDLFARHAEEPDAAVLVIDAERVRVFHDGQRQTLPIDKMLAVKALVRSLLAVLQGNFTELDAAFTLELQPDPSCTQWVLTLTPKAIALRDLIETIVVTGQGTSVTTTEVVERNGDRTRTTYTTIDASRRFTAAEKASLFRLDDAE